MNYFRLFHLVTTTAGIGACLIVPYAQRMNHSFLTINAQPKSKHRRDDEHDVDQNITKRRRSDSEIRDYNSSTEKDNSLLWKISDRLDRENTSKRIERQKRIREKMYNVRRMEDNLNKETLVDGKLSQMKTNKNRVNEADIADKKFESERVEHKLEEMKRIMYQRDVKEKEREKRGVSENVKKQDVKSERKAKEQHEKEKLEKRKREREIIEKGKLVKKILEIKKQEQERIDKETFKKQTKEKENRASKRNDKKISGKDKVRHDKEKIDKDKVRHDKEKIEKDKVRHDKEKIEKDKVRPDKEKIEKEKKLKHVEEEDRKAMKEKMKADIKSLKQETPEKDKLYQKMYNKIRFADKSSDKQTFSLEKFYIDRLEEQSQKSLQSLMSKENVGCPMKINEDSFTVYDPSSTWADYGHGGPIYPHPRIPKRILIEYKDFVVCYDNETITPMWSLECIDTEKEDLDPNTRYQLYPIRAEPRVYEGFRTSVLDYFSSFDKYKGQYLAEHDLHIRDMVDPCVCTNVVLQRVDPENQIAPTLWDEFRHYIAFLKDETELIYILTGTLYLPRQISDDTSAVKYKFVKGLKKVAIPTHFFKAILYRNSFQDTGYSLECYKFENKVHNTNDITQFLVNRHELEKEAGFLIFDKLDDEQIVTNETFRKFIWKRYLTPMPNTKQ